MIYANDPSPINLYVLFLFLLKVRISLFPLIISVHILSLFECIISKQICRRVDIMRRFTFDTKTKYYVYHNLISVWVSSISCNRISLFLEDIANFLTSKDLSIHNMMHN